METFIIDRQEGFNICIEVHKGKVKNIIGSNELFCEVMRDKYKGKSITFLRDDFATHYDGSYVSIKPEVVLCHQQIKYAIHMMIADLESKVRMIEKTTYQNHKAEVEAYDKLLGYMVKINDNKKRLAEINKKIEDEFKRIAKEHNFEMIPVLL